jgi:hypothetical protein
MKDCQESDLREERPNKEIGEDEGGEKSNGYQTSLK